MIRLDAVSLVERGRAVLDRAAFAFTPGTWHIAAAAAGDARLLIELLAGQRVPATGRVAGAGARSWPLAQAALFGPSLSGLDLIDMMVSLYALERRGTVRLFRDLFPDTGWLGVRFDRWPAPLQRRFTHVAFLAPAFDIYLLDLSPVLPDPEFYPRWRALFRERSAGKIVIMASLDHRAALRDFPGERLMLANGALHAADTAPAALPAAMAAE